MRSTPGADDDALLSFDCERVCDRVDGARPSPLGPGILLEDVLEDLMAGGGIALLSSILKVCSGASISSTLSGSAASGSPLPLPPS